MRAALEEVDVDLITDGVLPQAVILGERIRARCAEQFPVGEVIRGLGGDVEPLP